MEYLNIGIWTHHSTTPIFHHSNYSPEPFQMFFKVERLPPRLDTEGLGDNPRRVVSRSAGNVTTGMTRRAAEVKTVDWRPILTPARTWPVLQRLITGVLAHHPIAAIHVAVMPFDIERRGRIRRQDVTFIQVRRKALPNRQLFLKPFTASLVPVERVAPKIVSRQLPHERRRLARRRLCGIMKRRRRAVHKRFARQLTGATIFE